MSYPPNRRDFLEKALSKYKIFLEWTQSLVDGDDIAFLKKNGVKGVNLILFLLIFLPICWITDFGTNGVPYPANSQPGVIVKKKKKLPNSEKLTRSKKSQMKLGVVVKNDNKKIAELKKLGPKKREPQELKKAKEKLKEHTVARAKTIKNTQKLKQKVEQTDSSQCFKYESRQVKRFLRYLDPVVSKENNLTCAKLFWSLVQCNVVYNGTYFPKFFKYSTIGGALGYIPVLELKHLPDYKTVLVYEDFVEEFRSMKFSEQRVREICRDHSLKKNFSFWCRFKKDFWVSVDIPKTELGKKDKFQSKSVLHYMCRKKKVPMPDVLDNLTFSPIVK